MKLDKEKLSKSMDCLSIAFIYGPVLGGVVAFVIFIIGSLTNTSHLSLSYPTAVTLGALLLGNVLLGMIAGFLPALCSGLAASIIIYLRGKITFLESLLSGIVGGFIAEIFYIMIFTKDFKRDIDAMFNKIMLAHDLWLLLPSGYSALIACLIWAICKIRKNSLVG